MGRQQHERPEELQAALKQPAKTRETRGVLDLEIPNVGGRLARADKISNSRSSKLSIAITVAVRRRTANHHHQ